MDNLHFETLQPLTILEKKFVPFISNAQIVKRMDDLASQINVDYAGDCPVLIVVLNGAVIFASEMMLRFKIQCELCCVKYMSYEGMHSTGKVKQLIGLNAETLRGRRVIVVEDIIDTGKTIKYLYEKLKKCELKDLEVLTLILKKDVYNNSVPVRYVGFEISDKFVVGFGMDYNGLGRQYPDIYQYMGE